MSVEARPSMVSVVFGSTGEVDKVALSPSWRTHLHSSARMLAIEVLQVLACSPTGSPPEVRIGDPTVFLGTAQVESIVSAWDRLAAGLDAPEIRYTSPGDEIELAAQGGALLSIHIDEQWTQRAPDPDIGKLLAQCLRQVAVTAS